MKRTLPVLASVLAIALAVPASAYELKSARWSSPSVTLKLDPDIAANMPTHWDRLHDAADKLNANASLLRFSLEDDDDNVQTTWNGENEVAFVTDISSVCGGVACARTRSFLGVMLEADVFFSADKGWVLTDAKMDSRAYDPSKVRPLLNTAIHEFGHTVGLKHEAEVFNIMGNAWNVVSTNGNSTETVLSEDSTAGLVEHYGPRTDTFNDVSLYHWRRDDEAEGNYSKHIRTRLLDSEGVELTLDSEKGKEPRYEVDAGQTIQVEQTSENRGTSTETVDIAWFVSTNSTISTYDTEIGSGTLTQSVLTPATFQETVTLPTWLTSGQTYWVGVIIDADDALPESNESNNAVYIAEILVN